MSFLSLRSGLLTVVTCAACFAFSWAGQADSSPYLLRPLSDFEEARASDAEELDALNRIFSESYRAAQANELDLEAALGFAESLTGEGLWEDLDYAGSPRAFPPAVSHLKRMAMLAAAYYSLEAGSAEKDELGAAIYQALQGWYEFEPVWENRWYYVIGAPRFLAPTLFLAQDALNAQAIEAGVAILRRTDWGTFYDYARVPATGGNLVWVARLQLEAGVLARSMPHVLRASRRLQDEIRITTNEGIQADFSFHQHGTQVLNAAYGAAYVAENAIIAGRLQGTRAAYEDERIRILDSLMLDGSQWMTRGDRWFCSVRGRSFTRGGAPATRLGQAARLLAPFSPDRKEELLSLAAGISDPASVAPLQGHKHFWRSDLSVHHRPNHSYFLRMSSLRTEGTEMGNGENLKGYYMGDGLTMRLGETPDYRNIFPVWNWRRLPGVTCTIDEEPFPDFTWGEGTAGGSFFVGGLSDGTDGLSCFEYDRAGVQGRKAWFFLGDRLVMLGIALRSEKPYPLQTTIEQAWANGAPRVLFRDESQSELDADGVVESEAASAVYHNGYVYSTLGATDQRIRVALETRNGEWTSINTSQTMLPPVSGQVFTLSVEHGIQPQDGSYAIAISPDNADQEMELLVNSAAAQAVFDRETGLLQVVFWEPGSIDTLWGRLVVDQPCLIQIQSKADSYLAHVACPLESVSVVNVTLEADGPHSAAFSLPEGQYLGKTVSGSLQK